MTNAERIQRMAEIKKDLTERVQLWNEASIEGNADKLAGIGEGMIQPIREYNGLSMKVCYSECISTDNPMLEAVKRLTYPIIGTKDTAVKELGIVQRTLVDKEKAIDLVALDKMRKGGIGASADWQDFIKKLGYLMTVKVATTLGIEPTAIVNNYKIDELAKQARLGKNPASNNNLVKTLNLITKAMLGDGYKATTHDAHYLTYSYTRKSRKKLTIDCANYTVMVGYVAEICHRIVNDLSYDINYQMLKK